MCNPAVIFGAQVAGQLAGAIFGGQQDMAAYNRKIKAVNEEGEAITRSTIFQYRLGQLQQQQIQDKTTLQVADEKLRLAEAEGTGLAAAASGGVEGNSVQALLRNFSVITGKNITGIRTQGDNEVAQSRAEMKGVELNARNRMLGLKHEIPDDPSMKIAGRFIGAALGIGDSFLSNTTKVDKGESGGFFGRRF